MTKPRRNLDDELWNLMSALADSVFEADDEAILEEAERTAVSAEETRLLLLESVKAKRQERRQEARASYVERVASIQKKKSSRIPRVTEEQRAFLFDILNTRPAVAAAMTAQFRDFRELSDEDVLSYLKHLEELGVIDEAVDEDE
jgi:hypothetical protein